MTLLVYASEGVPSYNAGLPQGRGLERIWGLPHHMSSVTRLVCLELLSREASLAPALKGRTRREFTRRYLQP